MLMENRDSLIDELFDIDSQMEEVLDLMIEKYGKFLSLEDCQGENKEFKADLLRKLNSLQLEKDFVVEQITLSK